MKRLAIFGGSFNPIHCGHLAMARLACDHFSLESLLFVPTKSHPFAKASLTVSADQRAKMVEHAIADEPRFSCYRGEIDREGPSYAIDTILEVKQQYPDTELFYLIGEDNLPTFDKWHRFQDILNEVTLIVASRPGTDTDNPLGEAVQFFPSPEWGLSSSSVRDYLTQGLSCRYLLNDCVIDYISKNNLYIKGN